MINFIQKNLVVLAMALAFTAGFSPAMASAQQAVELNGSVQVERTVTENGEERTVLSPPEQVVPGDKLMFSNSFRNGGAEPVEDFVVTNPLPKAVRLAEEDAAFEVSVDGETFGRLSDFSVASKTGESRPAQLSDVTHLRWTLERVEPGASGSLDYQAIVR